MKHDDEDLIRRRRSEELIRSRQRSRSVVLALLLGALVLLVFFITLTRIQQGLPENAPSSRTTRPATEAGR